MAWVTEMHSELPPSLRRGKYSSLFGGLGVWKGFEILEKSFKDTKFSIERCKFCTFLEKIEKT